MVIHKYAHVVSLVMNSPISEPVLYWYFACKCVCALVCAQSFWRPEEDVDPVELELQMVVSCCVGTGN